MVLRETFAEEWPSDHYPVMLDVILDRDDWFMLNHKRSAQTAGAWQFAHAPLTAALTNRTREDLYCQECPEWAEAV